MYKNDEPNFLTSSNCILSVLYDFNWDLKEVTSLVFKLSLLLGLLNFFYTLIKMIFLCQSVFQFDDWGLCLSLVLLFGVKNEAEYKDIKGHVCHLPQYLMW